MILTRRSALAGLGGVFFAPPAAHALNATALSGAALYADVRRYVAFGPKRTATPQDIAVSRWIAEAAQATGATVALRPFRVRQFMLERASLSVGSEPVEAFPFWFPKATPGAVRGRLAPLDTAGAGDIAVSEPPGGIEGLRELPGLVERAAAAKAAGLIVVNRTPSGSLFGHGQLGETACPTLLVGHRDAGRLRLGADATMEIAGQVEPAAEAFNVTARVHGEGPLMVISTPTSAWFTSGGERGPGVALWLGLLRHFQMQAKRPNALFLAFSGHELRAAGARAFMADAGKPPPADVALWLHLGASIATYRFAHTDGGFTSTGQPSTDARLITNAADFMETLRQSFASRTSFTPELAQTPQSARGELRLYFEQGYRTFGFEGAHDLFHAPEDLDQTTGPELLQPVAEGIVEALTREGLLAAA